MAWILMRLAVIMSVSVLIQGEDDEPPTPCECSYKDTPQQNLVCKADWVLKAKVLNLDKKFYRKKWKYTVKVLDLYKPNTVEWILGNNMEYPMVTKKPNKNACGIELIVGNTYILSGIKDPNGEHAFLGQCVSLVEPVTTNSPKAKHLENLMTNFQANCDCTVKWVSEVDIHDEGVTDLDLSTQKSATNCIECMEQSRCTNRISYCTSDGGETCQWKPVASDQHEEGILCNLQYGMTPDCIEYICSCEAKPFLRYTELYGTG